MPIPSHIIAKIREEIDIVDVISKYVELKRNGHSPWLIGRCPFHNEEDGSFKVNQHTQSWFCYGCGKGTKDTDNKGSDVFAFIQEIEEVDFPEACRILGEMINIEITNTPVDPAIEKQKLLMHQHNVRYHRCLWDATREKSQEALQYLRSRGLDDQTIQDFRLGLVPDHEIQYRNDILDIANRIAIPIIEPVSKSAKTIGMAYRELNTNTNIKYKNDHNSSIFTKGNNLFGLYNAIEYIKQQKYGIIVECYFGTMLMHQYGVKNVVSCMGNMITENQLQLMKRYAKTWVILFDGDKGGQEGIERILPMALKVGINPKVAFLPEGEDPDTFIIKLGKEKFDKWLSKNIDSLLDVVVRQTLDNYERQVMKLKKDALTRLAKPLSALEGHELTILNNLINSRLNL